LLEFNDNILLIKKCYRIKIKCDNCEKIYYSTFGNAIKHYKKYNNQDLCRSCKQIQQYKEGKRNKQKEFITNYAKNNQKGKTLEEMYGNNKAVEIKKKISESSSGENHWNYDGDWFGREERNGLKDKTFEEVYGDNKAEEIKKKISKASSGKNNGMYGKPTPRGSGNGWSGWYKNRYFRSLLELSYMFYLDKNNIKFESAECEKFRIKYEIDNVERTYVPDFYLIDFDKIIEIKPQKLINSKLNKIKF
jgi:hypothetical protein